MPLLFSKKAVWVQKGGHFLITLIIKALFFLKSCPIFNKLSVDGFTMYKWYILGRYQSYSLIHYKGCDSNFKFFDGVQIRKYFISLPAFYLII